MASKASAAATAAPSLVVEFTYEKETPGTIRFKEVEPEDGSRPTIGTLYITKKALAGLKGNFKRLTVTVEAG